MCNYVVDLVNKDDKVVFKGVTKFSIKPKDVYIYELMFLPNAEDKFQVWYLIFSLNRII